MLLFGSQLRSYRDLPIRYAEAAPLHRNELAGTLHGLTRVRSRHAGRRAHLLHARADRRRDRRLPDVSAFHLRPLRHRAARRALDAAGQQARDGRGVGLHRREARGRRSSATRSTTSSARGRASFYGPKIDLHMRPTRSAARGRSGRSSSTRRCRPVSGSRTWAPTTTSTRSYVVHRALFGSLERFIGILIEHYAGAFPVWLAPVQVRVLPVAEPHREAVTELVRALAPRRRPRGRGRARRDARQADPRRRAPEDPVRRRLGRPRDARGDGRAQARRRGRDDDVARRARRGDRRAGAWLRPGAAT